jgi:hypothetical protein
MQVVEHPYSYEVRDDNGRSIKHFYFRNEPANVSLDGRMTKKQAEQRARAFLGSSIASPAMPALRRFLRPWQVIEHDDSFEITDAAGLGLAVVHFEKVPSRQTLQKRLSKDEARRMARKVARLSALRPIEKRRIDPGEF